MDYHLDKSYLNVLDFFQIHLEGNLFHNFLNQEYEEEASPDLFDLSEHLLGDIAI